MNRMKSINEFKEIFGVEQDRIGDCKRLATRYVHLLASLQSLSVSSERKRCSAVRNSFYALEGLLEALPEPYTSFTIEKPARDMADILFTMNYQVSYYLKDYSDRLSLEVIYRCVCGLIYIIENDYPTATDCGVRVS